MEREQEDEIERLWCAPMPSRQLLLTWVWREVVKGQAVIMQYKHGPGGHCTRTTMHLLLKPWAQM